ncbi:MAG: heat-inducible transcription repressor HrcA [Gemmatimonadetes bacterium]|nr:heat-inducible transcription repressor HrcA [Gemmatimonadota bacterium]
MHTDEQELTRRERRVLEAVIHTFVDTAAPAASRAVARDFDLGVSPATVRNTMSDLARKGYLTQAHPSAGRTPTDKAYRYYVDTLMKIQELSADEVAQVLATVGGETSAEQELLSRAVLALSVLTHELGLGLGPQIGGGVLERIKLVGLSSERMLIVLAIDSGPVRTIYVEAPRPVTDEVLSSLAQFLNERLAGRGLREIRETYRDRLSDGPTEHADLLNIFLEQADTAFATHPPVDSVVLGPASSLADQPEFADREGLRTLIELTEQKELLARALDARSAEGIVISIGGEHAQEPLLDFSLITTQYEMAGVRGTIGVMGPTRMPYERVVALVQYTADLLSSLPDRSD